MKGFRLKMPPRMPVLMAHSLASLLESSARGLKVRGLAGREGREGGSRGITGRRGGNTGGP